MYIDGIDLAWPQNVNGNLKQIKLGANVIYGIQQSGGSIALTGDDLTPNFNYRKIAAGPALPTRVARRNSNLRKNT